MKYLILYNTATRKCGYISKEKYEKLNTKPSLMKDFVVVGLERVSTKRDFEKLKRVINRLCHTFSYLEKSPSLELSLCRA